MDIGCHKKVISALNDLSGQTPKGEAKVLSASKVAEENPKRFSRQFIIKLVTKVKEMLYVAINQQVTLQNEDPICNKIQHGVYKLSLIDLEAYSASYGDRAQALAA